MSTAGAAARTSPAGTTVAILITSTKLGVPVPDWLIYLSGVATPLLLFAAWRFWLYCTAQSRSKQACAFIDDQMTNPRMPVVPHDRPGEQRHLPDGTLFTGSSTHRLGKMNTL